MPTNAQISANRANAQLSTGPTSETGKSKSSLNALKTGLTGRTGLLPGDDVSRYEAHISEFMKRYAPVGDEERNLVQSLADTEWRLLRIPALEMGIYAVGRLEFAELFPNEEEEVRKQLIEAKAFLAYQRQLNNLSIQEGRLRRQREKDSAALCELQGNRKRQEKVRLNLGSNFQPDKSNSVPTNANSEERFASALLNRAGSVSDLIRTPATREGPFI